ncbi:hypothetical protein GUITHDRAFT_118183 [Guillardia theta CCMP2712]|uniref:RWP-RK domain-containing protein n=1 Tax=Guillardia theta (strain CCMP2712) TaxID=905079 RepID=L1IHH2_GUITC|nr:hypothetical protein GUITHDRAFT_118183 [Guillardia theta CCMP2712]EKX35693.1 hypothetical protein GUITHDRAFT_118183 [Guillardia theta CCMP2712]|eukprot:XP_005822673.1 hypothetical protein GUITHDRAFT_118183 [Guillardia theta CCMP2712]
MSEQPKARDSVTVTPKRAGEGASAYDVQLDLTIIEPLFHMRQKDAAKFLGISLTTLKRSCRLLGVQRWPYAELRDGRAGNQALLLGLGDEDEDEDEDEIGGVGGQRRSGDEQRGVSSSSRTTPRIDGEGTSSPQSRGETPGSHTESAPEPSSQAIDAHWLEWYLSCEDEEEM